MYLVFKKFQVFWKFFNAVFRSQVVYSNSRFQYFFLIFQVNDFGSMVCTIQQPMDNTTTTYVQCTLFIHFAWPLAIKLARNIVWNSDTAAAGDTDACSVLFRLWIASGSSFLSEAKKRGCEQSELPDSVYFEDFKTLWRVPLISGFPDRM